MPNPKKVVTRFPELFTDPQFRKDVLGRVKNTSKAQSRRAKTAIKRGFSKADRFTFKILDQADKLMADHKFIEADDLLIDAIKKYENSGKINQKTLFTWLAFSDKRAIVSLKSRVYNYKDYQRYINEYKDNIKERNNGSSKIAVVSAISGGYDSPKLPANLNPNYDYFLFTDTKVKDTGIFTVKPLPYIDGGNTRSARFIKTNVHRLLPDYDIVIWIDANVMILGDIQPLIDKVVKTNQDIGLMRHPLRDNLYDEGKACIDAARGNIEEIKKQLEYYKESGFVSSELFETNVIVYNLKSPRTKQFLNYWWSEIDKRSERDQISIDYCIKKAQVNWVAIMDWPNTARNNQALCLTRHGQHSSDQKIQKQLNDKLLGDYLEPLVNSNYPIIKKPYQHDFSKIDVIYCVYNALEDVKICLKSVKKYRIPEQRLIIVDDGSNAPTKRYLNDFYKNNKDWVILNRSEKPSGYTKAANRGLKMSDAEFSVLLNSDTVVTKDWLSKMATLLYRNKDIGIIGPLSSAASQQSIPVSKNQNNQTATNELPSGITPEKMNELCEKEARYELMPRVPLVHGFCLGIKKEVIDKIGYFDENKFPRGYGEENDYCFRAIDAGFGLMLATNTYIFHAKSKSYIGPERIKLMNAGMQALVESHSQNRISRAVLTMENNPILEQFRNAAAKYYKKNSKQNNFTK